MKSFKISIDGPAASGKSTISKLLSHKLGWHYINTGVMFRIVTLYLIDKKVDWLQIENKKYLQPFLMECNISYFANNLYFNGRNIDLTLKDRILEIDQKISLVSSLFLVRKKILSLQQDIIKNHDYVIMDGRDIGTVVMPHADLKIFLVADIEVRILRRQKEFKNIIDQDQLKKIAQDIKLRDQKDINRSLAPLRKAEDAILLDTTKLDISETIHQIYNLIQQKMVKNK